LGPRQLLSLTTAIRRNVWGVVKMISSSCSAMTTACRPLGVKYRLYGRGIGIRRSIRAVRGLMATSSLDPLAST
jgi:hypothetical protein